MKALIKVGYGCNENCSFCHTLDVRHIQGESSEVHAKIERAAELGHTMVVFSGGEATIRSELFEWAAHAVALGMDTGLVTNGLMLAYDDYLNRLLALRLKYVYMSLHGGTAKIHNLLVRASTFDAAEKALANISGKGLDVTVNCVVTKQNLNHLKPMVDLVLPFKDVRLKFSMVQPKGGGDKLFYQLTPRVSEVGAKVHEAIAYGLEKTGGHGPAFGHDGIPFCHVPGYESLFDDLKTHRYWTMVEVGEPDFFPVDDKAKVQPAEKCGPCAMRGACPGLFQGYREEFGIEELKPVVDRPRSNSYNYIFEQLVSTELGPLESHETCPVKPLGITPWDRGRHLFVKNGPRLARFRAESRDFSDVEIDDIKHGLGQVYLDVSRKVAPDDFQRDLVQLRRALVCGACPERDFCTGLHEPVFEDVFGKDDAHVREIVAGLSGEVLDVGCGEGPYEEILAPLARSGRIRYTGLEPDVSRVARLRARWPWATVEATTAEAFVKAGGAGRFDHVLVLRSWNHLSDPRAAAEGLVAALKPGGSLLVVDNTAFGLARTPAQANRGQNSTSAFEHYRNDRAVDAEPILTGLGLRLVERREVGVGSSNQWLLRYSTAP
jgi:MoaA/NifB/PqqE/SkfB family radical SAM enzyme/2-polyprenyl-3-methyl-5-hydroxy-6-metoxy-1,4-benzoquinol methylase